MSNFISYLEMHVAAHMKLVSSVLSIHNCSSTNNLNAREHSSTQVLLTAGFKDFKGAFYCTL